MVSPYLWSRGFSRLDAIALSHGHSDHISGLPKIVANFRPRELWLGPNPRTQLLDRLLEVARHQNLAVVHRAGGEAFNFGEINIQVLSPPPDWQVASEPRNNDSLALRPTATLRPCWKETQRRKWRRESPGSSPEPTC